MSAIDISGVTKRYGTELALDGLDLTVESGEIYGFLGPNGAGKSTTINLVLDFIRPTRGDVRVFDLDVRSDSLEIRNRTGILPEGATLYDRLTGRQHVEFAIESKAADDDPDELLEMREIIREENARGATIFFSSHVLGQVEAVCDRVGILRDGHLIAEDTIDGLRDSMPTQTRLRVTLDRIPDDSASALEAIDSIDGVSSVEPEGRTLVVACEDRAKTTVLRRIEDYGVSVEDFETDESSLEDLFVAYTSDSAGSAGVIQ